jgi:hypothetical protein
MFGLWRRTWEGFTSIADAKIAGDSIPQGTEWRIVSYDVDERVQELSQTPDELCPDCYKEPVARHRRMVMQRAGE